MEICDASMLGVEVELEGAARGVVLRRFVGKLSKADCRRRGERAPGEAGDVFPVEIPLVCSFLTDCVEEDADDKGGVGYAC